VRRAAPDALLAVATMGRTAGRHYVLCVRSVRTYVRRTDVMYDDAD
jgi:hypothetical protein